MGHFWHTQSVATRVVIRETEVYSLVCNIASYVIFDLLFESVALIDLHIESTSGMVFAVDIVRD